jgi:hypothetical protein
MMAVEALEAPFPMPWMSVLLALVKMSVAPLPAIVPVPDLLISVVPAPSITPRVIRPRRGACKEQPCSQSSDQ